MISEEEIKHRYLALQTWLKTVLPEKNYEITLLAGDASFRRYYRIHFETYTLIAMDAPPALEDSHSFYALAHIFGTLGLLVPTILAADVTAGFLLLHDLGDNLYFTILTRENFRPLYNKAIEQLLILQQCPRDCGWNFPVFDAALFETELSRFKEWYLEKHLQIKLTSSDEKVLTSVFQKLIQSALAQPQVCVHRDYHSRNLFLLDGNKVGIIDFQDALWGPISYDLVSLIRDCYIAWPKEDVLQLAHNFYEQTQEAKHITGYTIDQFSHDFDWMGMQRHLKAIYIFARKWRRDANSGYLNDIPRTLSYVYDVCKNYAEFSDFQLFLEDKVLSKKIS